MLLALCILTGPLQVPDEPAHFFRAIQISHGNIAPILAPDGHAAGGFVDAPAAALAEDIGRQKPAFAAHPHLAAAAILADGAKDISGPQTFIAFSNTVIYFPTAYAIPAAAIATARWCGAPPLAWLYAGRLANAAAALAVSWLAIRLFGDGAPFAFALCMLPRVLFEEASLSADALVLPFGILFWAVLRRLATGARHRGDLPALFLAVIYVCVGKIAYIPLAVLPPVVLFLERRRALGPAAISAVAIAAWLTWSLKVHNEVFPIGNHTGIVDAHLQLHYVLDHPVVFLAAVARSVVHGAGMLLQGMAVPNTGWRHTALPWPVTLLSLFTVAAAGVFRGPGPGLGRGARWAISLALAACFLSVYLLLYLEFTPVGSARVDGVQGRYFIPLIAAAPLFGGALPRRPALEAVLIVLCALDGIATVMLDGFSYW